MTLLQVSIAALLLPKSEKKDTECERLLRDAFEILFSHVCVIYLVSQKTRGIILDLDHMGFHMHPIQLITKPCQSVGVSVPFVRFWSSSVGWFACSMDSGLDRLVSVRKRTPVRTLPWLLHSDATDRGGGEALVEVSNNPCI